MSEDQNRKQRIVVLAKKIIEETLLHRRDDEDLLVSQIKACEAWDDDFLNAVEQLLEKGIRCLN